MTGKVREHGGGGGRVEGTMMDQKEASPRTESGPRLSHVNIVDR